MFVKCESLPRRGNRSMLTTRDHYNNINDFSTGGLECVFTWKIVFVFHRVVTRRLYDLGTEIKHFINDYQVQKINILLKWFYDSRLFLKFANTFGFQFHSIVSVGQLQPLVIKIDKCKFTECVPIGLHTDQYPARGVFSAGTAFFSPYCSEYIFLETDLPCTTESVHDKLTQIKTLISLIVHDY